ncbi:hypothetical protein E4634_11015 [Mangrovimicrobium sediminis]|uniref:Aromatic-ring-hydroxylating dioxygenase subunit beta n=1 Tax=Mangrovimicrobium sediminis TaxID=2562682 RepID=A0A4Z0M245_9GAMM|nr:aromatic-ring-hydroxylating dioxygenase subunit beta [Haliea sp. SAOS-164]TGD73550.1 hypothetical protein E4634_11015 [Haliea sp. SAOS-164]
MSEAAVDFETISRVEQFYYREARLLDERCLQQWMALVDESLEYSMPARFVPQPDPTLQDTEAFLSVERELSREDDGMGAPLRQDGYLETFARTFRPFKSNAWSECPAPRTRRFISNVEVQAMEDGRLLTYSNFHMFYSHRGADNHTYTGGRRDVLMPVDGGFKLCKREVILDMDVVTVPTLALIF